MATTGIEQQRSETEARVAWDRRLGRPGRVRWGGREHRVLEVVGMRDETAAFPAERGPRVTLRVTLDGGARASLAFDRRRGKWYVEVAAAA